MSGFAVPGSLANAESAVIGDDCGLITASGLFFLIIAFGTFLWLKMLTHSCCFEKKDYSWNNINYSKYNGCAAPHQGCCGCRGRAISTRLDYCSTFSSQSNAVLRSLNISMFHGIALGMEIRLFEECSAIELYATTAIELISESAYACC